MQELKRKTTFLEAVTAHESIEKPESACLQTTFKFNQTFHVYDT